MKRMLAAAGVVLTLAACGGGGSSTPTTTIDAGRMARARTEVESFSPPARRHLCRLVYGDDRADLTLAETYGLKRFTSDQWAAIAQVLHEDC